MDRIEITQPFIYKIIIFLNKNRIIRLNVSFEIQSIIIQ